MRRTPPCVITRLGRVSIILSLSFRLGSVLGSCRVIGLGSGYAPLHRTAATRVVVVPVALRGRGPVKRRPKEVCIADGGRAQRAAPRASEGAEELRVTELPAGSAVQSAAQLSQGHQAAAEECGWGTREHLGRSRGWLLPLRRCSGGGNRPAATPSSSLAPPPAAYRLCLPPPAPRASPSPPESVTAPRRALPRSACGSGAACPP